MDNHKPVLGVDIGNVIIGQVLTASGKRYADTTFLNGNKDQAMGVPPVSGSFAAIRELLPMFDGRIWLISKCGLRIQLRTIDWLNEHRFFSYTGLPEDQLRFCFLRSGKRPICENLGVTHFVDDRPDIITMLDGVVGHRYLFGPQEQEVFATEDNDGIRLGPSLHLAPNWLIARQLIRRTLIHQVAPLLDDTDDYDQENS